MALIARNARAASAALLALLAPAAAGFGSAAALTVEIEDVAPDRVERQRAYAEGALPLAGTPDLGQFKARLAEAGVKMGDPLFIRIFKAESELELWMRRGDRYILFATYPICHWSGTLGPKVREGDKQNPEGFYTINARQLHRAGRWPQSLNLGFPNSYDKANSRTGSYILIHGGCSSVGCYAMTNAVMAEIFALSEEALRLGQESIPVHVFPFRMTDGNLARYASSPWQDFWRDLKRGYDAFEQTKVPPRVGLCEKHYVVESVAPGEVGEPSPLASCGALRAAQVEPSSQSLADLPPSWPQTPLVTYSPPEDPTLADREPSRRLAARLLGRQDLPQPLLKPWHGTLSPVPAQLLAPGLVKQRISRFRVVTAPKAPICNPGLASCRRFLAISAVIEERKANARTRQASAAAAGPVRRR